MKPTRLTGSDEELAELLCDALNDLVERSEDARDSLSNVLVTRLGAPLDREAVATRPGRELVSDLARRLREMLDFGLAESFVVRALRDEFTQIIEAAADVGKINGNRAEARKRQLDLMADPDAFRTWCEERRPGSEESQWTDEQIRADAERIASAQHLGELSPDRTAELWATHERWAKLVGLNLTDSCIERWNQLNMVRKLRESGYR